MLDTKTSKWWKQQAPCLQVLVVLATHRKKHFSLFAIYRKKAIVALKFNKCLHNNPMQSVAAKAVETLILQPHESSHGA